MCVIVSECCVCVIGMMFSICCVCVHESICMRVFVSDESICCVCVIVG